jgi:hypothetical protein
MREWRETRRRNRQRREVIAKHAKKTGVAPESSSADTPPRADQGEPAPTRKAEPAPEPEPEPARGRRRPRPRRVVTPPLPLPEPESTARGPVERKLGGFTLPPHALLDPPRTERKVDERELMEARACSRRSAASSRWRAPSCRSTRARWSPPTSSSPTPA